MFSDVKQWWIGWLAERGLEQAWEKFAETFPVLFFAGGFVMDAVTLGRNINLWTLGYVGACAVGVIGCFAIRAHGWFEKYSQWVDSSLHFLLGAVFSALVVLYFRSAGTLVTGIAVAVMVGAMLWNEVAARGDASREILWAVFALSLVMYLNFLLPYAVGSLSALWFYGSIVVTLGVLWGTRHLINIPRRSLIVSSACAGGAAVLFVAGAIPPVPLAMKRQMPCIDAEHVGDEYVCQRSDRRLTTRWGLTDPRVEFISGERVSVMSAVAAPRNVSASLEHRWYRWSSEEGWLARDTIPVRMTGGRDGGWRFYSYKQNIRPGFWRVETAVPNGSVLSYVEFSVRQVEKPPKRESWTL